MLQFRLLGIPVMIQPFFWLIMAYLGGGVALFSNPTTETLTYTLVFMAAGFLSILVHEYGHALMMKKYGRFPQIVLHGMGGVAMSSGAPLSRMQNFLVIFAGPLVQILLGLIALAIIRTVGGVDGFPTHQSYQFFSDLFRISLFWAILNLIPIYPLDGGQILGSIVGPKNQKLVHIIGIVIGILLAAFLFTRGGGVWGLLILGLLIYENFKALGRS